MNEVAAFGDEYGREEAILQCKNRERVGVLRNVREMMMATMGFMIAVAGVSMVIYALTTMAERRPVRRSSTAGDGGSSSGGDASDLAWGFGWLGSSSSSTDSSPSCSSDSASSDSGGGGDCGGGGDSGGGGGD